MGIACWVEAESVGLTPSQQSRYCGRASGSGRLGGATAGPSSGGSLPGLGVVPVVVGNRVMMQREGVRLPDGLEDLLVPEVRLHPHG